MMHTGIGSDGLLLLEISQLADFKMRYFNSDGYESEMCANGSRCTCYMAKLLGIIDKKHSFACRRKPKKGMHIVVGDASDRELWESISEREVELTILALSNQQETLSVAHSA